MKLNIKIKLFPHPTETFIITHILGLLKKGVFLKIYTNIYKGMTTYDNPEQIEQYDLESLVHRNFQIDRSLPKFLQILKLLGNFRTLRYGIKYYVFKPVWSFEPLYHLHNYKDFDDSLICHVQFNTSLKPLIDLTEIGYLNPKKVLITFHGYDAFRLNAEKFYRNYADFYQNHVQLITVNSNYIKNRLIKVGIDPSKIHIIPIGIDVESFNYTRSLPSNKTIHLVTVGRLIQLKGHKYGIRVLRELLNLGYKATYTIIGSGLYDFQQELEQEANNLRCKEQVNFTGYLPQVEIKKVLLKSFVFLMTSTFDDLTFREEAFGLVAVEAQALGLPIIAFDTGGVSDTLIHGQTGFLIEDRNVEAMTEKVILLHDNKELYQEMSMNAKVHACNNFDNNTLIERYLDLYNQMT